jgi:hypothetical protein
MGYAKGLDCNVHLITEKINLDYTKLYFPISSIEYKKTIKCFDHNKKYTKQIQKIKSAVIAIEVAILVTLK